MRPALRFTSVLLLTFAWGVAPAILPAAADEEPPNYAKNPGFETPWLQEDDGLLALHGGILEPTHWWPRHAASPKEALYKWDQAAYSGARCVRIDTRRQDPSASLYEAWSSFVDARDLAGSTVTLRAMVKAKSLDDSARVEFRIHAFQDGIALGNPCGASSGLERDAVEWTEHTLTFLVPDGASHLMLQLGIVGRGTAWYDDAALDVAKGAIPSDVAWPVDLADPRLIFTMDSPGVLREAQAHPTAPLARKEWNVLLYAAADFPAAYNPLQDFASRVQSNEHVNVLIFEDPVETEATIWFVDRSEISARITPVLKAGESETDGPEILEEFLRFAKRWFPAKRTLVYLYGHGHAWWGACNDPSNDDTGIALLPQDWLTPPEMRTALEAVGGVDAVFFSAPCVMSSLEAAYELRDVTKLYVASEEVSGYNFWKEAVAPIAVTLARDPDQDVATLGRTAIDSIRQTVQAQLEARADSLPHQPAIAATATCSLSDLAEAVDAFSAALLDALPAHRPDIRAARDASTTFVYGELVDVYSLAVACRDMPGLRDASAGVMRAIDRAVIAQVARAALDGEAYGLSLYFPVLDPDMPTSGLTLAFDRAGATYLAYGLSFVADTRWSSFLRAFFAPFALP